MKIKTVLAICAFVTSFSLALTVVSVSKRNTFGSKEVNPQTRVKIYNFLSIERKLISEMNRRQIQVPASERLRILADYQEARLTLKTDELPPDFKEAWLNNTKSEVNHLRQIYADGDMKAEAIEKVSKERDHEYLFLAKELRRIAGNYGFELDESNILADEIK